MQTNQINAIHQLRTFFMPGIDTKNITTRFSERIRQLRSSRGLSQIELAEKCGMSTEHLDQIESGRMTPTLVVLELLSHGFEVSISGLVEGL